MSHFEELNRIRVCGTAFLEHFKTLPANDDYLTLIAMYFRRRSRTDGGTARFQ